MAKKKKKDKKKDKSKKKSGIQGNLIESIQRIHFLYERKVDAALLKFDLSNEQYRILEFLCSGEQTAYALKDIRESLPNQTSNTTRLVEKLNQKKYVSKKADPSDKRALKISISALGNQVFSDAQNEIQALSSSVNGSLKKKHSETVLQQLDSISSELT